MESIFLIKCIFFNQGESGGFGGGEAKKDNRPFFKTFATLAIPNITMTPGLDEVQQAVNKVRLANHTCTIEQNM